LKKNFILESTVFIDDGTIEKKLVFSIVLINNFINNFKAHLWMIFTSQTESHILEGNIEKSIMEPINNIKVRIAEKILKSILEFNIFKIDSRVLSAVYFDNIMIFALLSGYLIGLDTKTKYFL
jgi:hypothetical protein